MIMEIVLREGSLWEGVLDGSIAIETSTEGAFYPVSVGNWREGHEYPDLWGWAIRPSQVEAFESLYMARRDDEVAKGFADSAVLLRDTRRYGDEKSDDPVSLLFQTIRRRDSLRCAPPGGFTL